MATADQLAEILARIEGALTAQATTTEARFVQGDANVQSVVQQIEKRMMESEKKLADALTAVQTAMVAVQAGVEQKLAATEDRFGDAVKQLTIAITQVAGGSAHTAQQGEHPVAPGGTPGASASAGGAAGGVPTVTQSFDPWAGKTPSIPPGGGADVRAPVGGERLKSKDFAQIAAFDGELGRFPDWADRMTAKFGRAHPRLAAMLSWAETQTEVITEAFEQKVAEPGVDVVGLSTAVFDVLMERTGPKIFDKRRNAGPGRGLEFWRILKRDFGTSSADAQLAKLQMYTKPVRCTTVQDLGAALDKWEALGRELTRPVDDDFRLLALRELVPKAMAETMSAQVSLRSFPEAMMFVRRQVAEHRHAHQVQEVHRQAQQTAGPVPMDISALVAAIAQLRGEDAATASSSASTVQCQDGTTDGLPYGMEQLILAVKGKGKGKGKEESRSCYQCGKQGHLARNCPTKSADAGLKGKSKGKGKGLNALSGDVEDHAPGDIVLNYLVREGGSQINSCRQVETAEWNGHECVEVLLDSGAGECVCGPDHFEAVNTMTSPDRTGAGVEYICADGGRIPNLGEKRVQAVTDEGSRLAVNFQVAPVDRPLIAVSKLTAAGHHVFFGKDAGVILHSVTGAETKFQKRDNVYVMKLWVPKMIAPGGSRP